MCIVYSETFDNITTAKGTIEKPLTKNNLLVPQIDNDFPILSMCSKPLQVYIDENDP